MKAVVVYESMFGNTRVIAEAIGEGLAESCTTTILNVNHATLGQIGEVDLMLVGAPTHVHGLSRMSTREEAWKWAGNPDNELRFEPEPFSRGIREWLDDPRTTIALRFCAFGTRTNMPEILSGSSTTSIERALRHRPTERFADGEAFLVGKGNRLEDGEVARAHRWGKLIGLSLAGVAATAA